MKRRLLKISGFVLACVLFTTALLAQQKGDKWVDLGTKSVDRTLDRDVVQLTSGDIYTALRIEVESGVVNVYKTTIHFKNGEAQDVTLPEVLTKENNNGLIDLKNNRKVIDKITFWYDTKNSDQEKAVIKIRARK